MTRQMLAIEGIMEGDVEGSRFDLRTHADGFASGGRARDASKSALISHASSRPCRCYAQPLAMTLSVQLPP